MKYLLAILLCLSSLRAATLNVPGAYATVQAAVTAAQPGDTIVLAAGTYSENIVSVRNASSGLPITIDGQGVATLRQFYCKHTYHVLQNLRLSGVTSVNSAHLRLEPGAGNMRVNNCVVDINYARDVYGIQWTGTNGSPKASNVVIENSIITHGYAFPQVSMDGDGNVIRKCQFLDGVDVDFLRLFGNGNTIEDNIFDGITAGPPPSGNHPDWIQTFGNAGEESRNHVVQRNIVRNIASGALAQLDGHGQSIIGDWVFKNNLVYNVGGPASIGIKGVKWFNNTFYKASYVNKGNVLSFGAAKYMFDTGMPKEHPLYVSGEARVPTPSGSLDVPSDPGEQYGPWYSVWTEKVPEGTPLTVGRTYKARTRGTGRIVYNGVEYNNAQEFTVLPGITSWSILSPDPNDLENIWLKLKASIVYNGTTYTDEQYFRTVDTVRTFTSNYADKVFLYRALVDFAEYGECRGNVFLDCGDPVNDLNGWYAFNGDYPGITADFNYVSKNGFTAVRLKANTIPVGSPGWGGKGWYEPNGINGGNPGLVDFSNYDFRLDSGSALIDQGETLAEVDSDFVREIRPRGTVSDIGAYEYAGSGQVVNEYYVSTAGSDAAAGTAAAPFRTIQFAVNTAAAGKPIYVAPGTYAERVTTARNGSASARVRVIANGGVVTTKGFIINHPYTTLDGITATGHSGTSNADAHFRINAGGDFTELRNCAVLGNRHLVRDDYVFTAGTNTISTATGGFTGIGITTGDTIFVERAGTGVTLSGNNGTAHTVTAASNTSLTVSTALSTQGPVRAYITASYQYGVATETGTTDCLIKNCTFTNTSFDAAYIVGTRNTVEGCTFTGIGGWDVMHFGGTDITVQDCIFKDNPYIVYSPSADVWENLSAVPYTNVIFRRNVVSNFAGVISVQKGSGTSTGLQIRNNMFIDVGRMVLTHPNTSVVNNSFVRTARNQSVVVARADHPIYVNESSAATGVTVQNNVFYDCGESATANQTLVGWYEGVGLASFSAQKNFASGISPGYAAKVGWPETTSALNGGNPGFVDISSPLGVDGVAFTADDGLRLAVGSKLIAAGVGNADIGAYGVVTSLPPATPSGLTSVPVGSSGVVLSWTDESDNESSFEIARSGDGVSWVTTDTVAADIEQWVVNGLLPSTTYYWRLRALNSFGQSAWSSSTATTTAAAPPVKNRNPRTSQGIPQ
jgi:hypothetical protein